MPGTASLTVPSTLKAFSARNYRHIRVGHRNRSEIVKRSGSDQENHNSWQKDLSDLSFFSPCREMIGEEVVENRGIWFAVQIQFIPPSLPSNLKFLLELRHRREFEDCYGFVKRDFVS